MLLHQPTRTNIYATPPTISDDYLCYSTNHLGRLFMLLHQPSRMIICATPQTHSDKYLCYSTNHLGRLFMLLHQPSRMIICATPPTHSDKYLCYSTNHLGQLFMLLHQPTRTNIYATPPTRSDNYLCYSTNHLERLFLLLHQPSRTIICVCFLDTLLRKLTVVLMEAPVGVTKSVECTSVILFTTKMQMITYAELLFKSCYRTSAELPKTITEPFIDGGNNGFHKMSGFISVSFINYTRPI